MLFVLGDAKDQVHRYVDGGSSIDAPVVVKRINEALRRLIIKGNWKNTYGTIRIYTQNNTITLPRGCEKCLGVNIDGDPRRVFTPWYEFLSHGPGEVDGGSGKTAWKRDLKDEGNGHPVFFDPPTDTARKIFAVSTEAEDKGQQIRLKGYTTYRNEVRQNGSNGEIIAIGRWTGGIEGQLDKADFPELTDNTFTEVTSVHKPVTRGYVSLYSYDEDTDQMWFLGKYHPDETTPDYRRYRLLGACMPPTALDTTGNYYQSVLCLVKTSWVKASEDHDVLCVQNLDAIKNMVIAIEKENSYEQDDAVKYEATAIRILKEQLGDSQTIDNTSVNIQAGMWSIGSSPNIY